MPSRYVCAYSLKTSLTRPEGEKQHTGRSVAAPRVVLVFKCVVLTLRIHHILLTFQRPQDLASSVFQEWHYNKNLENLYKRDL